MICSPNRNTTSRNPSLNIINHKHSRFPDNNSMRLNLELSLYKDKIQVRELEW